MPPNSVPFFALVAVHSLLGPADRTHRQTHLTRSPKLMARSGRGGHLGPVGPASNFSHAATLRLASGTDENMYSGTLSPFSRGRVQQGPGPMVECPKSTAHYCRAAPVQLRNTSCDSQGYTKPLMRRSTLPPFRSGNLASCVAPSATSVLHRPDLKMLCSVPSVARCTDPSPTRKCGRWSSGTL